MSMDDAERRRRIHALKHSQSYRQAHLDPDFMGRAELRPVRLQLELLKPELTLQAEKIVSTIVVFGGTRIVERDVAQERLRAAQAALAARPKDPTLQRDVRIAQNLLKKAHYYDEAREFGRIASSTCQIGQIAEYVVVTGGGPGIMEAANRGACEAGAKSIGLNITIPTEQEPNPYITPELCFEFKYFAIRKMHFLMRAKAMVAFPGGFGTLDELFETLTLIQTRKMDRIPVVLFGREYWEKIIAWDAFLEEGVIAPQDLDLLDYAESAAEVWKIITEFYEGRPQPHLPRGQ
jgi:uncharacterized protein (TIGR00730 family)